MKVMSVFLMLFGLLVLEGCAGSSPSARARVGDPGATFGQVDLNGNGLISQEEFDASGLPQSWRQVDLDSNGYVDQDEYRRVYGPSALDLHHD
ncbi:hypothetical protein [Kushneria phosphatilytica]|nr:hypothetical protein [Kushneria phosphatilytica]